MKKLFLLILLSLSFVMVAFTQTNSTASVTPGSQTQEAKKPTFRATKDQTIAVQTKLKETKLYTGELDGKSSPEFKAAVKSWQKDNGLTANGSLNRATLEKMGIELTDNQKLIPVSESSYAKPKEPKAAKTSTTSSASAGDAAKRPAPFQADKDQIMALQKILIEAKIFAGPADGARSDDLKAAVKQYQEANGLKATGGINAETLAKAGIALTEKQKMQVAAQAAYNTGKSQKN